MQRVACKKEKMFLFNKSLVKQGVFQGFTDNHSHILPGVDDGVKTMEESLDILADYEQIGVSEVWLTPHVQEYMPNTTEGLRKRFAELTSAYKGSIKLHLAAEYMLDALFQERLKAKDLLLHSLSGEPELLLVETSYFNPPMGLWGLLSDIMSAGIRPILAHPERYQYMEEDDYNRLHEMGILLQLNLPSLVGAYGTPVQKRAKSLLSKGYYSFYGTDIHSRRLIHMFHNERIPKVHL